MFYRLVALADKYCATAPGCGAQPSDHGAENVWENARENIKKVVMNFMSRAWELATCKPVSTLNRRETGHPGLTKMSIVLYRTPGNEGF